MKLRTLTLTALVLVAWLPASAADTAYVIDKLLVGVHQDRDLNSAIIKVLPTGTKLEVLARDGELAEVRDTDGTTGWVDAAYLMTDAPAAERVEALTAEVAALKQQVADGGTAPAGDRDELTKENTDLKGKLSAAKLKVGQLEAAVSTLEAKIANRPLTEADTIIEELERKNQALARDLESAVQASKRLESELDRQDASSAMPVVVESLSLSTPVLAVFGIGLVLAFGGGVYAMDYLNRRRHGGFRV